MTLFVSWCVSQALFNWFFFTAEDSSNIVNNLPVGVPVPVGVPMSASLLQNHNLLNTSIIIGNDDCSSPMIIKSAPKNITDHGDIKISYIQKPLEDDFNTDSALESQNLRWIFIFKKPVFHKYSLPLWVVM